MTDTWGTVSTAKIEIIAITTSNSRRVNAGRRHLDLAGLQGELDIILLVGIGPVR